MKFQVDSKALYNALSDIRGKGKYTGMSGLSTKDLGEYSYLKLEGNSLELWNGDATMALSIVLDVQGEKDGDMIVEIGPTLSYLKAVEGEVSLELNDTLTMSMDNGRQVMTLPRILEHPDITAITRIRGMIADIGPFQYTDEKIELPLFGESKFEAAFNMHSSAFDRIMRLCELVKTGIYRMDFGHGDLKISSGQTNNNYTESTIIGEWSGEEATVEWSGPLHKFFKNKKVSFYVKDEFPILLVSDDRKLIRAPHVG